MQSSSSNIMFGSMLADTKYRKTSQQRKVMIWGETEPVRTKNKTAVNTASVAKITNWLAKHRHTVNTRKSSRNDNDNDNDNDTLREVHICRVKAWPYKQECMGS